LFKKISLTLQKRTKTQPKPHFCCVITTFYFATDYRCSTPL